MIRAWLRRRSWRLAHRRYGLRLTFAGGYRQCPDWDESGPMWAEFDRAVAMDAKGLSGDLLLVEAVDDGAVVGSYWTAPRPAAPDHGEGP